MGLAWHDSVRVINASEVDYGAGVAGSAISARGLYRLSFQALWANYTAVTVKLQGTLDDSTWADISGFSITTSGNLISSEVGPYRSIRVHITGTLSGGADTLSVYLQMSRLS